MNAKDNLVRFGVAMESSLIEQLDALAAERGCNRSELLRDLTRAEVSRTALDEKVPAFAAVTLVYNHHVRELSERLTMLQHDLGEAVRSSMHVHLDHEHCLEVIVMRGRSDQLKEVTGRMIGTRGVIHGGAEYVAENTLSLSNTGRRVHAHDADAPHSPKSKSGSGLRSPGPDFSAPRAHAHSHPHEHAAAKAPAIKLREKKPARVLKPAKKRG